MRRDRQEGNTNRWRTGLGLTPLRGCSGREEVAVAAVAVGVPVLADVVDNHPNHDQERPGPCNKEQPRHQLGAECMPNEGEQAGLEHSQSHHERTSRLAN